MRVESLDQLQPVETRCVVINVGTDLVATRAVLSAVTRADLPVVLLNTDPAPSSREHFDALMSQFDFDVIEVPLRYHGDQLDYLLGATADERLLLLDSDAELRDLELVRWMIAMTDRPSVFGAGFVEGPFWMPETWLAPPRSLLYMQRPWMPCVLLRVDAVRAALDAGRHFREFFVPNELWFMPRVANFLAARFPPPWGRASAAFHRLPATVRRRASGWALDGLRWARQPYYGLRPKMACYDTGARVYEYLRFEQGLVFAGVDVELAGDRVHHYGGVTRSDMFGPMPMDVRADAIRAELDEHLARQYGYGPGA